MEGYKPRIADKLLRERLEAKGAVLIEGPKWCGKTTTAAKTAHSAIYMDDPDTEEQNLEMAQIRPSALLAGEAPRLIDEWQIAPKLWDAVRFQVDRRGKPGQFILTGSSLPPSYDHIHHTGAGRISWLRMRTMSLYESGDSTGEVSLRELFNTPAQIEGTARTSLERLAFLTCRGGWPAAAGMSGSAALLQARDYYEAVVRADISRVDGISRKEERVRLLMRSYARNQGTQSPVTLIRDDMIANDSGSLDEDTVRSYIAALEKIFVIEETPAYSLNLRSKATARTSNTRYFTDPSIATAALGLSPDALIGDLRTFGFIFETLCMRDLRIYAEASGGSVYHFRDSSGLECDAVVCFPDGSYGLIEIKLGSSPRVEAGAQTLLKIIGKIDARTRRAPSFAAVLTGVGQYAYRREDGIYVVPIGCLKD